MQRRLALVVLLLGHAGPGIALADRPHSQSTGQVTEPPPWGFGTDGSHEPPPWGFGIDGSHEPPPWGFGIDGSHEPPPGGFGIDGTARPVTATAALEGSVKQQGNRDPLADVRVVLSPLSSPQQSSANAATRREALTDQEGRFRFTALEPGEYRIELHGPGRRPQEQRETLNALRKKIVTYYVPPLPTAFQTVVRAESLRRDVSEQVIEASELRRIPGTQNDAIKAVENLPGVARAPLGSGQLVIWGSSPRDTAIYANRVSIPNVFHVAGLRSTINSEFVSEVSFKPGAYGADYGGHLGGQVEIALRPPKSDRVHGSATLDLIDGSATVEGPITKKLHVAAGVRVSWISVFLPLFSVSSYQISPVYWDYQLALRYKPSSRDDLDLYVLGATDQLRLHSDSPDPAVNVSLNTRTYFSRVLSRWSHRFDGGSSLFVQAFVGGSNSTATTSESGLGGIPLSSESLAVDYGLRAELRQRITSFLHLDVGLDFYGYRDFYNVLTTPQLALRLTGGSSDRPVESNATTLGTAVWERVTLDELGTAPYLIARFELWQKRLTVSPQLRLSTVYQRAYEGTRTNSFISLEPRLFASVQVIPRWLRIKLGLGNYTQNPSQLEVSEQFGNPLLRQQNGITYVAGIESEPSATLSFQGQFFYREMRSLIVSDPLTVFCNDGIGRSLGADFLIRQRLWRGLFGWLAYTLSQSERKDHPDEPWRRSAFDQTHILTAIVSYKLPWERLGIEVGVRFRYATGNPTTPVVGGVRDVGAQSWLPLYGPIYSARLPDFHQLDLRIDKTWTFNRFKLDLYLDIQNLYNRVNTEQLAYGGRQLVQSTPVSGIPIFPNLGVRAEY